VTVPLKELFIIVKGYQTIVMVFIYVNTRAFYLCGGPLTQCGGEGASVDALQALLG